MSKRQRTDDNPIDERVDDEGTPTDLSLMIHISPDERNKTCRFLLIIQQEGDVCDAYSLKGRKFVCDAIGNALEKSHEERLKGTLTTFNHVTLSWFIAEGGKEGFEGLDFEETEDVGNIDELLQQKQKIFSHYFGETTMEDIQSCKVEIYEKSVLTLYVATRFDAVIFCMGFQ